MCWSMVCIARRLVFVRVEVEGVGALVSAVAYNRLKKHTRSASAHARPAGTSQRWRNETSKHGSHEREKSGARRSQTGAHRMIRMNSSWLTAPSPSLSACTPRVVGVQRQRRVSFVSGLG